MNEEPREVFAREAEMRATQYRQEIDTAIELLQAAKTRFPSDHLGHNLSARANALSVAAAKWEAAKSAERFFEMRANNEPGRKMI